MTDQPMTPRRPRRRVRYRVRPLPVVLPLFTPISEDDEQCTVCGALNTRECDSFTSFGGCTLVGALYGLRPMCERLRTLRRAIALTFWPCCTPPHRSRCQASVSPPQDHSTPPDPGPAMGRYPHPRAMIRSAASDRGPPRHRPRRSRPTTTATAIQHTATPSGHVTASSTATAAFVAATARNTPTRTAGSTRPSPGACRP